LVGPASVPNSDIARAGSDQRPPRGRAHQGHEEAAMSDNDNVVQFNLPPIDGVGGLDYPQGAAAVRDRIRVALEKQGATKTGQGGGLGEADLWIVVDGCEYSIVVKPLRNGEDIV
jgi:hypothetical protein